MQGILFPLVGAGIGYLIEETLRAAIIGALVGLGVAIIFSLVVIIIAAIFVKDKF